MTLPLVDVVIVTYNQREFIKEAIESVLSQDYSNTRVIVADDGSTDGTQELIKEYSYKYSNVVPVLSEKNTGIASNFNRALKYLKGKYVAWLGGDDLMLPEKLSIQVNFLESNPQFSGCYTDAEVFEHPSGRVLGLFSEVFAGGKMERIVDIKKFLNPKTQLLPSTFMVRREYIPQHGFDERFRILNDFLFDAEVIVRAPFGGIPKALTKYRRHKRNIGKNENLRKLLFEENLMVIAVLESRYPFLSKYLKKRKNYYILLEAIKSFSKNRKRAKDLIKLAYNNGDRIRALGCYFFGSVLEHWLENENYRRYLSKIRRFVYK